MKRILIINPNARAGYLFVPYLWLCFKSHHQEFAKHPDEWEWLEPVSELDYLTFDSLVESIIAQKPDVIGFSMLLWNEKLNHRLGEEVKKALPDVLIVAGGPHLSHRYNQKWFSEYPWVDAICNPEGYGEEFMTEFLDRVSQNQLDFKLIPNAVYPGTDRLSWHCSPLKTNKTAFTWPSYVFKNSEEHVQGLSSLAQMTNKKLILPWETNRGCPYGCVYCEWGGGIMSKMNMKPMETISRELQFLKKIDLHTLHINDANFGILKRDLQIAESVVELGKENKVKSVWLGGKNKNNKDVVQQIDHLFLASGLGQDGYQISVNALDAKQLKAINRTNIAIDELIDMATKFRAIYNIESDIELILGLPESNLESVFQEFDVFDKANLWKTERFPWALLPETPAAGPEYQKKYQVKTVRAAAQIDDNFVQSNLAEQTYNILRDPDFLSSFDQVVETSTYSKNDWVEMFLVSAFVRTMECSAFTTDIRTWLKMNKGMLASVFFQKLWFAIDQHPAIEEFRQQLRKFVNGEKGHEHSYLWFKVPFDHSKTIKLEAAMNLMILSEPASLFDPVRRAFKDIQNTEFFELIDSIESRVIKQNIFELCTQVSMRKIED